MRDNLFIVSLYGKPYKFQVIDLTSVAQYPHHTGPEICLITSGTLLQIEDGSKKKQVAISEPKIDKFTYSSIGGLNKPLENIKEIVHLVFHEPKLLESYG